MKTVTSIARNTLVIGLLLGAAPASAGIFDSAPQAQAPVGDATIAQIKSAFDDQRYLEASKLLDRALVLYGNEPRLAYWAGQLSLTRGRYDDALANFKSIGTDSGLLSLALEGQGVALAQLGRNQEAVAMLKAAVAKDPTAWRAWNALGSELDRLHDWAGAETAYGQALSHSGNAAIVLNNRGFSRVSQDKLDEAILDFVAALQKKPDMTAARNNLRLAMAMKGEYDRAIKGANASDQASVLNNAGYAAMLRGDYVKAQAFLSQAMTAKGEYYARAAENLAMAQSRSGTKDKD